MSMKEELQGKLVEILTSIQTATGQAKDFALSQLPDIAQSYVMYGRALYTAGVIVPLLVAVAALVVGWRVHFACKAKDGYYDSFLVIAPSIVASTLAGTSAGMNFAPMLLVWLAPKVWLLKELAAMVK